MALWLFEKGKDGRVKIKAKSATGGYVEIDLVALLEMLNKDFPALINEKVLKEIQD